ncbi:MAG TPA: hypothetical protein VF516_28835 [Kofleriaceae bacterium]
MFKSLLAATATLSLVACVQQDDGTPSIDRSLPTADQVSIKVPKSTTSARTADGDVLGQLAPYYVITLGVTSTFNGGTAWVLTLIHAIVQTPPTTIQGNVYTWDPGSNALDPADYKLVVTANADGTFSYELSGKSKTQPNAQFEILIKGSADPRPGEAKGKGEFTVDFDAGKRVNPIQNGDAKGSMDVNYDLAKAHIGLTLTSTDAQGNPAAADYSYTAAADGGGDMTFGVDANVGGTAALETLTLHSRWLGTGAGRTDARITGGDLGIVQVTASECWSTSFGRVYYHDSGNFALTEGAESSCAIPQ